MLREDEFQMNGKQFIKKRQEKAKEKEFSRNMIEF